jgi:hypothetical protein
MMRGKLTRRTLLKGVGVAMGLPLLDAMRPLAFGAASPKAAAARRFAVLYMPNGVNPFHWAPKGVGSDFQLSEVLSPLEALKQEILVLENLWNQATNTGDGHYVKTGGFLTSTTITRTTGADLCAGNTSVDQLIARQIGNLTPLPSLELGIEPVTTGVDTNVGFTRLYGSHISWSTPTTPLAKEINPKLAFDRLFRSTAGAQESRFGDNLSVLDLVADDAKALRKEVGEADRRKLDEYFDSVRAVETRIEFDRKRKTEQYLADPRARQEIEKLGKRIDIYNDPAQASERGVNHTEHVRLMLDIMALAFWTDSTRVSTFMFGNAVSGRSFSFLDGVSGGHHENSHHADDPKKLENYKRINRWHVEQYAYLLNKLKSMPEGAGSVLDNSMILFGAGMRDGNKHDPHNLPLVLAGRAGGDLSPGRHLIYDKNSPMADLHLSILHRMGVRQDKFADGAVELKGLSDPTFTGNAA